MRVTMIKCDICKKEIEGNPFKFSVEQEDRTREGQLADIRGEIYDESVELYKYDYCPSCVRRMMRRLMGKPAIIHPGFDQAVNEMIQGSKKEEMTEETVDDVPEQQEQDQGSGKTVLQYFDEAKVARDEDRKETFTEKLEREEAEKQGSFAKKNKPGIAKSIDAGKFRTLCEAGWKLKDLSIEFGVSEQTISAWKKKFL
ncbi:MAG: helix-turn-helix domain-containing protein [Lachnospiraceae bacterium]|nr:helix-turn-helix domain-containing protein [Lachnospiraceae bacterium]